MRLFPTRIRVSPLLLLLAGIGCGAQVASNFSGTLAQARFSHMAIGSVALPWRTVGLPAQKAPLTRFDIQTIDNGQALRVRADGSYGNLVIDAQQTQLPLQAKLQWRWQLVRGLASSDLQDKSGDDAPVKVCALFDMKLDALPFGERARLRMARAVSGEPLPSATLCYVWDRLLAPGQVIVNVFSPRVRYLVLNTGSAQPGVWQTHERLLAQDFLRAFGQESAVVPPLTALVIGADADNTGDSSLAWVGDLQLTLP